MKKLSFLIIIAALCTQACKKTDNSNDPGKATYTVRMTDAPGPYQQVNIDLRGVEITGNGGSTTLLNVKAGIYDLLKFSNGLDTMIATGSVTAGTVEQIRLILGPNNTVVINGDAYVLDIPSSEQSGLKLQVHQTVEAGASYMILLDFDANKSIIETGSGQYKMKPVIRTINKAIGGSIKGSITPVGTMAVVTASNGTDSFSTSVSTSGYFMVMGLAPGNYTLTVTPVSPFKTVTRTMVSVSAGATTDVGVVDVQ